MLLSYNIKYVDIDLVLYCLKDKGAVLLSHKVGHTTSG